MAKKNKTFGLKKLKSKILLEKLGFNSRLSKKVGRNTSSHSDILRKELATNLTKQKRRIGKNLIHFITDNIKKIIITKSYKGIRHKALLPVRGQRTHTNARTVRKINSNVEKPKKKSKAKPTKESKRKAKKEFKKAKKKIKIKKR